MKLKMLSPYPNFKAFLALLRACIKIKDLEKGCEIHAEIARTMFLQTNIYIGSSLVDMYLKCGSVSKAQEVFDGLPDRNIVTWTALMSGYVEHGAFEEALHCMTKMRQNGLYLDAVTFSCGLKACSGMGSSRDGYDMHVEIVKKGFEMDLFIGSTLVDMYAKCGCFMEAQGVFVRLQSRNVVSWNAIIGAYIQHEF